jgi:hypothetical protein
MSTEPTSTRDEASGPPPPPPPPPPGLGIPETGIPGTGQPATGWWRLAYLLTGKKVR